ncbi:DUF5682 family protein [Ruminococcus sp.]|uniref:DUF5682 family protein n=1 Tax=Ruminococcus sp. TaxID=41978 RepID=UPI0025830774|nr:DUF5682 family protein [Ruminococcus sp.]MCR5020327.1 DUF5682 family protein [Ruminococcus sp.]
MDGIFKDSLFAEITGEAGELLKYDTSRRLLFFPVRHHSPVCSYQLLSAIEEFSPTAVLVEGPENANDLIPVLTDERTELPAAFYYFYKDKKKLVSEDAEDYKCYYPFLYSSPEFNALAAAAAKGITAAFIDLPYSEILIHTAKGKGLRKDAEKHSYTDDTRLIRSQFYKRLCEKTGIRNFEEFWEKYFEIEGLKLTPAEFCKNMHTYCVLTRSQEKDAELEAEGTLARERHMALRIKEALDKGEKVLVVTGGLHSLGLAKLMHNGNFKAEKLHKMTPDIQGSFPTAYSYEAADALHGYASGMRCPAFYDSIMKRIVNGADTANVYNDATLELLIKTAKESSKKDIPISIADITSAETVMSGLAALRNVSQCGLSELADGITSAFIKGEKTISSAMPLDIMKRLATGDSIGRIGDKNHVPPLVADFEKQCDIFKLKYASVIPQEADVPLFLGERGLALSRLLHRLTYLDTGFATLTKGPDLKRGRDRSRVRELWKYRRTPQVDASLIDHTTDGFTIEEACTNLAARALNENRRCQDAAQTAIDCFLMGIPLTDHQKELIDDIVSEDGDFFSIGEGLRCFARLCDLQKLYEFEDSSSFACLEKCMSRLIPALPTMANSPEDKAGDVVDIMRLMYSLTGSMLESWRGTFEEALLTLAGSKDKTPEIYGAAMGLLYSLDPTRRYAAEEAMRGFLQGSEKVRMQGADYLKGLFCTAGDIVLADDSFLYMTDDLITGFDREDYLEILPSMRLAFSHFTPSEIQSIAKAVAGIHGVKDNDIMYGDIIDEGLSAFGRKLDSLITAKLNGGEGQ